MIINMKNARLLLNKSGISVFFATCLLGILRTALLRVLSRLWGLCLRTTPEGYLSNANLLPALLRSPWIVPAALILLLPLIFVILWEMYAVVLGIGYAVQDQNIRSRELLAVSFRRLQKDFRPANYAIALFALVLLPLTNIFRATEWITAYVVPEYIDDFIHARVWLWGLYLLFLLAVGRFVVRRLYMLPIFVLTGCTPGQAARESIRISTIPTTRRGLRYILVQGIGGIRRKLKFFLYQVIETIRLGVLPYVFLLLACFGCYYATRTDPLAKSLIVDIGLDGGKSMIGAVVGSLIYISIFCLLISDYMAREKAAGQEVRFSIPQLRKPRRKHRSLMFTEIQCGLLIAVIASAAYLVALLAVGSSPELLDLLHPKSPIIAHKGYSSKAPENTMAAFALADTCPNADMIELDVWSTKDGIPVVIHNASIQEATGKTGYVYDYTYAELQQFPAVYHMNADTFGEERIPALEDVLAAYAATTPILIEIKGYRQDSALAEKIVALMDKYDCKYTSMIHSGDRQALQAVKAIDPDIQCGLIMAFVTGDCYDLPYADFFSVEHTFINNAMLEQIHLRGKKVFAWTVNFDSSAQRMRLLNADAIITDYPDGIAQYDIPLSEHLAQLLNHNGGIEQYAEGSY